MEFHWIYPLNRSPASQPQFHVCKFEFDREREIKKLLLKILFTFRWYNEMVSSFYPCWSPVASSRNCCLSRDVCNKNQDPTDWFFRTISLQHVSVIIVLCNFLVENTVTEELSHDRNHDYYNYWCLFCLVIFRLWLSTGLQLLRVPYLYQR